MCVGGGKLAAPLSFTKRSAEQGTPEADTAKCNAMQNQRTRPVHCLARATNFSFSYKSTHRFFSGPANEGRKEKKRRKKKE